MPRKRVSRIVFHSALRLDALCDNRHTQREREREQREQKERKLFFVALE